MSGQRSAPRSRDSPSTSLKWTLSKSTPAAEASCRAQLAIVSSVSPKQRSPTTVTDFEGGCGSSGDNASDGLASRRTAQTGMPSPAAKWTHRSFLQQGPERQVAVGRLSNGQESPSSNAKRKAFISEAAYARSFGATWISSCSNTHDRRVRTPVISLLPIDRRLITAALASAASGLYCHPGIDRSGGLSRRAP